MKHRYLTIWLTYCNFLVLHSFLSLFNFKPPIRIYNLWLVCCGVSHDVGTSVSPRLLVLHSHLSILTSMRVTLCVWRGSSSSLHLFSLCGGRGRGARYLSRRDFFAYWSKTFVDHIFFYTPWEVRLPFQFTFPLGIVFGLIAVCVTLFNTCNRAGHWQPGSLAGVAHLLERNTDVPRTAPWGQKPLLEFKGKSCLNLCTLSTSTQCLECVIALSWVWSLCVKARPSDPLASYEFFGALCMIWCMSVVFFRSW